MKKVKHITSEQLGSMVGDKLGTDLWFNGMMNEIRRYPNEIPCDEGEIPSMIIPRADGTEKVEWGFTAGMSCLLQEENGEITVRRGGHFPACAALALLSLLADAGADKGEKVTVTLRVPDTAETSGFKSNLKKIEEAMQNVSFDVKPGREEEKTATGEPRAVFDLANSVAVVQKLQQIDVGRFAVLAKSINGDFEVGDDLTITDGQFKELQTHCPALMVEDADDDLVQIMLAMWFPEGFTSTGMNIIKETVTPGFVPEMMPQRPVLRAEGKQGSASESKLEPSAEAKAGAAVIKAAAASDSKGYAPEKTLTSQLAAIWLATGDSTYRDEYLRRLKICGLSSDTADKMLKFEEDILKKFPRPEMLDEDFIKKSMFTLKEPFLKKDLSYYSKHFELPLSYIVKLSDEAEWHYWNSHEKDVPAEVWSEISALSDRNMKLAGPFYMNLVDNMGWTVGQVNNFSYNEQGMLNEHRWGTKTSKAAKDPWNIKAEGISFEGAAMPSALAGTAATGRAAGNGGEGSFIKKHKTLAIAFAVLLAIICLAGIGSAVKKAQEPKEVEITDIESRFADEKVTLGDLGAAPLEFDEIENCVSVTLSLKLDARTEVPEEWAGYYRSDGEWNYAGSVLMDVDEMTSGSGTQLTITIDDDPKPIDAVVFFPVIEDDAEFSGSIEIEVVSAIVRQ